MKCTLPDSLAVDAAAMRTVAVKVTLAPKTLGTIELLSSVVVSVPV
jgi:hypothetical protein